MMKKDLRGTWPQALVTFFLPIILILVLRWLFIEPFVIPSGSMLPNLLIHDHIVVNKLSYGIQNPFLGKLSFIWARPQRGDVIVFRFPENPSVFYVKRVIGLPGDRVEMREGQLIINGDPVSMQMLTAEAMVPALDDQDEYSYFDEKLGDSHIVRYRSLGGASFSEVLVGDESYFVLGDNRDQSMDSRYWGFVPQENLIGRASRIWLSCEKTLVSAPFLCDPQVMRWNRFLKKIQ